MSYHFELKQGRRGSDRFVILECDKLMPHQMPDVYGYEDLMKFARAMCAKKGGRILVYEGDRITEVIEFVDGGEFDPELHGRWVERKGDPGEFGG